MLDEDKLTNNERYLLKRLNQVEDLLDEVTKDNQSIHKENQILRKKLNMPYVGDLVL